MAESPATHFAPAGRADAADLRRLAEASLNDPVVQTILDAVGGFILILNEQRQVLSANKEVLDALEIREMDSILGLRPGEVLDCEYSTEGPDGCGTSRHCQPCGAVIAILAAQAQKRSVTGECCMNIVTAAERKAMEMKVRATPLRLGGEPVVAFVFQDVSSEKRREALEDVFLHDLRNTLTGLTGWADLLAIDSPSDAARKVVETAARIREELEGQYLLVHAEKGDLEARERDIPVQEILNNVETTCSRLAVTGNGRFSIELADPAATVYTDPTLLNRVLVNMMKNGLEATSADERVRLWFEHFEGRPTFFVRNPGLIPEQVQVSVFRRTFTTKAEPGRGMGTYSMKLFGEHYLGGQVSFTSTLSTGTTFSIALPSDKSQRKSRWIDGGGKRKPH